MACSQSSSTKWVVDMINAKFNTGKGSDPNYRAYFCVDCGGDSLRKMDVDSQHYGHNVLQALTCSREYGYNIYDVLKIPDLLDVKGVCPYKVNTGFVFFPKTRMKGKPKKTSKIPCVVCGANLSNNAKPGRDKFCSILCKLESGSGLETIHSELLRKNRVSLKLKIKIGGEVSKAADDDSNPKKKRSFDNMQAGENNQEINKKHKGSDQDSKLEGLATAAMVDENNISRSLSFRKNRRKGIPCRSPLF